MPPILTHPIDATLLMKLRLVVAQWQVWCRSAPDWESFFAQLAEVNPGDLLDRLVALQLIRSTRAHNGGVVAGVRN